MRTWILCSAVFFALALVFFHRQFHRQNQLFAAWLIWGVSLQVFYSFLVAAKAELPRLDLALSVASWAITAAAMLAAARGRALEVNQIILAGLAANLALHLTVVALDYAKVPQTLYWWASNVCGFVPSLYMLVRFSGARLDRLPLFLRDDRPWFAATRQALGFVTSYPRLFWS